MTYHIAQLNLAMGRAGAGDPAMAPFFDAVSHINSLAELAPGFVWRLKDEDEALLPARFARPGVVVNMSVWASLEDLRAFSYTGEHLGYLQRRSEWFQRPDRPHLVLWWIPEGHHPTWHEGAERLALLETSGPSRDAFTFGKVFPAPTEVA